MKMMTPDDKLLITVGIISVGLWAAFVMTVYGWGPL